MARRGLWPNRLPPPHNPRLTQPHHEISKINLHRASALGVPLLLLQMAPLPQPLVTGKTRSPAPRLSLPMHLPLLRPRQLPRNGRRLGQPRSRPLKRPWLLPPVRAQRDEPARRRHWSRERRTCSRSSPAELTSQMDSSKLTMVPCWSQMVSPTSYV